MTITTLGLNEIATDALDAFDSETYLAIGTGTAAELLNDTALGTEVVRSAIYSSNKDTANYEYEFQIRVPLGDANGINISEIGLFDAASSGNMAIRKLLDSVITKTNADELYMTLKVSMSAVNG